MDIGRHRYRHLVGGGWSSRFLSQQLLKRNTEGPRQAVHRVDRDVPLAAFDRAHVRRMKSGSVGELLLSKALGEPLLSEILGKHSSGG